MAAAPGSRRRGLRMTAWSAAVAGVVAAATITTAAAAGAVRRASTWHAPRRLADTGLYADFASRTVAPGNLPYSPQYPLWTDGATKRRWIRLPPGTSIDARDPEVWRFPVGTRLWKEFSWGRRVETRMLERTTAGWRYASYRWLDDESDAVLAPEGGETTTMEVAPGRRHAIPSIADCRNCHQGGRAEVLGFGALQLSPDRDPLAPNREALEPGMVTLDVLVNRGLLRGLPRELVAAPPRIEARTPRERAVLGYLHANCSICHDARGPLGSLGADLRHPLVRPGREPAADIVGQPASFRIPGAEKSVWVAPGAPSSSALYVRMSSRNPTLQMPPLGTQVVDAQAVKLVREWIEQDLRPAAVAGGGPSH